MVEDCLLEWSSQRLDAQTGWYFLVTTMAYSFLFSALVVGGIMMANPELKESILATRLIVTSPPLPPPLGGKKPPPPAGEKIRTIVAGRFIAPNGGLTPMEDLAALPPSDQTWPEAEEWDGLLDGGPWGEYGGQPGGVLGGAVGGLGPASAALPPPPPEEPARPEPEPRQLSVSSGVLQGKAIRRVSPVYPAMARSARVSGAVQVEVVIDKSGNVISASVVEGHPLLRPAAKEAARQWKFRPTLLSNKPMKVTGILIFNFKL